MTKSWPSASLIAWPSLLWIGSLHLGALLALLPSYFSGTALRRLRGPPLANG